MGLGGPVWHASAKADTEAVAWAMLEQALAHAGDPVLGEWRERGRGGVMHLRRRLSHAERVAAGGLGVRDIRGTGEERMRMAKLLKAAPQLRAALAGMPRP